MHIFKKLLFVVFTFFISFSFLACGYKPSSYYAKQQMEGNVFVKLNISLEDPKNAVLVKDAINKILIQKLDSRIVNDQNNADVMMNLAINSVSISTLQYDKKGYNKLYKAVVVIKVDYFRKDDGIKNLLALMENMILLLILGQQLQILIDLMQFRMLLIKL